MCWQLEDLTGIHHGSLKTTRVCILRWNFDAARKPVLKSKFHGSRVRGYFLWLRAAAGALCAQENASAILGACLQVLLQATAAGSELQPLHMSLASLPPGAG